jgi:peptidoglycan/LPS O-acetylase OafA/YrhL
VTLGPTTSDRDFPALTTLRFLAAAMVFVYHFPPQAAPGVVAALAGQGHVGVTVFFVLSGFLITVRYSEALGRPGGVTLREYFRKRVARIVPLYWAVLGVSLVLTTGGLEVSGRTLPEWTLTQGFFSRSVAVLTVPTSWTLTLEECFYATAPLLFLALRSARALGALVLLGWTAVLLAMGAALTVLVDPERFQFLGSAPEMLLHTFFGRFADFALGVWGGRLFLSGSVPRAWARPRGPALAVALGAAGAALVLLGQAGMALVGGQDGPRWGVAWAFNLVVGGGSLALILGLTSPASVLTRALSLSPLVYLGRVSYALYLIQLTPLGKGLLYSLLPQQAPAFGLLLYAGMTLVSALLYELVEEPGRRLVLRLWSPGERRPPRRHAPSEGPSRARAARRWALAAVVAAAALVQAGAWAGARAHAWRGLPTLAEAHQAASGLGDRVAAGQSIVLRREPEGTSPRVAIPESWMIGPEDDRRAPPSLLVYVDGEPVPFNRRLAEADLASPAGAHYRRPRTTFVELRLPPGAAPTDVTLVRHDPLVAARLLARRVAAQPALLAAVAAAAAAGAAAGWLLHGWWRPRLRPAAALALAASTAFLLAGVHVYGWAPLLIALELLALGALALASKRARGAGRPGALTG